MTAGAFDVNASFPPDPKHRATVEALVAQAAQSAGCSSEVARAFADEVGTAFVEGASTMSPSASVGVRVDRAADTIEVAVSCGRTVRLTRPVPLAG